MIVTCDACRGQTTMRYWPETPEMGFAADAKVMDTVTVSVEPCRKCKGTGRIEATWRIAVMQDGRRVGTVMPSFDPDNIDSRNPLYRPRPGDFHRDGDVWIASTWLGNGDLEAVPGFQWERD